MQLNPYLMFDGNCEAAITFYAELFGGKVEMMLRHAGSPAEAQTPKEWLEKILHARLSIGDQLIMASDAPPGHFQKPQGFSVSMTFTSEAEIERVYKGLATGAQIMMPLAPTFWAARFAMLTDRFGVPWMLNYELQAI